jgi:hypothetical protein
MVKAIVLFIGLLYLPVRVDVHGQHGLHRVAVKLNIAVPGGPLADVQHGLSHDRGAQRQDESEGDLFLHTVAPRWRRLKIS